MPSSSNKTISYPNATICDKPLSPQCSGMGKKELKTLKLKSDAGPHCLHCYWYTLILNLSPSFNFLIYTVDLLVLLIKVYTMVKKVQRYRGWREVSKLNTLAALQSSIPSIHVAIMLVPGWLTLSSDLCWFPHICESIHRHKCLN